MKKTILTAASALLITGLSIAGEPGNGKTTYEVSTDKSKITWKGEKVIGSHTGTLSLASGSITFNNGELVATKVTMDMTTIVNTDLEDPTYNQKLVGHLKSDDFFSVDKHPKATFEATNFKEIRGAKEGQDNYTVTGNLTIKGITHQITFPVRIAVKSGKLEAYGKVVFDRTKWNIRYGSGSFFDGLGDNMIYNDIELTFALIAESKTIN